MALTREGKFRHPREDRVLPSWLKLRSVNDVRDRGVVCLNERRDTVTTSTTPSPSWTLSCNKKDGEVAGKVTLLQFWSITHKSVLKTTNTFTKKTHINNYNIGTHPPQSTSEDKTVELDKEDSLTKYIELLKFFWSSGTRTVWKRIDQVITIPHIKIFVIEFFLCRERSVLTSESSIHTGKRRSVPDVTTM